MRHWLLGLCLLAGTPAFAADPCAALRKEQRAAAAALPKVEFDGLNYNAIAESWDELRRTFEAATDQAQALVGKTLDAKGRELLARAVAAWREAGKLSSLGDVYAEGENGRDGHSLFMPEERAAQEDALFEALCGLQGYKAQGSDLASADKRLNQAFQAIKAAPLMEEEYLYSVFLAGQRAWLKRRDAWAALVGYLHGAAAKTDALATQSAERATKLEEIAKRLEDN